jgi:CheY-like chemotaxis protein
MNITRILVVDDEAIVADSIKLVLASDQNVVETVTSAEKALAAVQANQYDVIIVDYQMPQMKGDKLAAAIKALTPQLPIIMITAYGEALRHSGEFPLAVDKVISKPFDFEELREAVRQLAAKA